MESEKKTNVRDRFLTKKITERKSVDIIMRTGYRMRNALIVESDDDVIVVDAEGGERMLYQDAIATIQPPYIPNQHYVNADWNSPAREFIRNY